MLKTLLMVTALSGSTIYADSPPTLSPSPYSKDTYGSQADQVLSKRIRDRINSKWPPNQGNQVKIQVYNGNVTLQGSVPTWENKEAIETDVKNITGVRSLNNQIIVQSQSGTQPAPLEHDISATTADEQLNQKIRSTLGSQFWNQYPKVVLNTKNGMVTLDGSVRNINEQQKLVKEIQKVDGVKGVHSQLKILASYTPRKK